MSSDFGHILSVGATLFKDRFALAKKVGKGKVGRHLQDVLCTWKLPWLAVGQLWSALAGPFLTSFIQTGAETTPVPL